MDKPVSFDTLCGGCKWGRIIISRGLLNMEDEDDDSVISSVVSPSEALIASSLCTNPILIGPDRPAVNMGMVTLCEEFCARAQYNLKKPRKSKSKQKVKKT